MKRNLSDIAGIFAKLGKQTQVSNDKVPSDNPLLKALSSASGLFQMDQSQLQNSGIMDKFNMDDMSGMLSGMDLSSLTDSIDMEGISSSAGDLAKDVSSDISTGDGSTTSGGSTSGNSNNNEATNNGASTSSTSSLPQDVRDAMQRLLNFPDAQFEHLKAQVKNNLDDETLRRQHVKNLWQYVRAMIPTSKLCRYINSSQSLTSNQKHEKLSKMTLIACKLEFVLGWLHLGGVTQSPKPTWERSKPDNLDDFYKSPEAMGNQHTDWAPAFIGYAFKRIGLDENYITSGIFSSAYQCYQEIKNQHSALLIDADQWSTLRGKIASAENPLNELNQFWQQHFTPQSGDLIVIGRSGNRWNSGNSGDLSLVEKYDSASGHLHIIQGDFDRNRAGGEILNLTETSNVSQIVAYIKSPASKWAGSESSHDGIDDSKAISLITGTQKYLDEILKLAMDKSWFNHSNLTATVAELYQD